MFNRAQLNSSKEGREQLIILTRHFFRRLFLNDVVDFEDQMIERLVGILVILGYFSGLLSYGFLNHYSWDPDLSTSWVEKCAFITFCMLVMGLIAVLEWDIIFPDLRDYRNLHPLPIREGTFFLAKFASLGMFVGLFTLSMIAFSTPIFTLFLSGGQSKGFFGVLILVIVHIISLFLAIFFAFFFVVLIIGILMTLMGYKLFLRVSTYIRTFLLITFVFLIVLYLRILIYGVTNLIPAENIRGNISSIKGMLNYFPPIWFTDIYETLLGNKNLVFHGTMKFALGGLILMVLAFSTAIVFSYRNFLKSFGTSSVKKYRLRKLSEYMEKVFNSIFLRNHIQRAVFHFYKKTLRSTMFLKMKLASYFAIGVGIILILIVPMLRDPGSFLEINKTMLSIPLILAFFLLLGVRGIVNIPVSLEANWVFQLTEVAKIRQYVSGLRKGVFFLSLLPLFGMFFVIYSLIWDGNIAFFHCVYGFVLSLLILEIFFLRFIKIPFSCSYLPGKEKFQVFWIVYLLSFVAYINVFSWIELHVLKSTSSLLIFGGVVFLIIISIRLYHTYFFYKKNSIKYEEDPEPVMVGFDYETPRYKKV